MDQAKEDKGTVSVIGGTGYVASWLIMRLLHHGYKVRTSIRLTHGSKKDVSYLRNLPCTSENQLEIFNADMDNPESFNEVIQGSIAVFHVAHPGDFEDKEPEEIITKRAINGTLGILKACLRSKTVKRVVYTSSAFTVLYSEKDIDMIDETNWTNEDYVRTTKPFGASYIISKTLTEKAVIDFGEKYGLDVVTIIPPMINGPFICPRLPGSVYTSLALVFGDVELYKHLVRSPMIHIDDVASAHIFLLEYPDANGRYICSSGEVTIDKISEFIRDKYPEYDQVVPTPDSLKEVEMVKYPKLSSKKLLETGFKFRFGLEEMYDGAIQSCKEKGFL
ncbi:vestitone reductase [Impatiens glandulifera]|uniref:vestitone reductase n=1 Tax=Impatiens glandulifera TaxID=253017 RepID=UPI001FB065FE|nr:vestitone reductase [Impatiens glandulifera]